MLTTVQWVYFFAILICAFAGGYFPLTRREQPQGEVDFPNGKAFACGVFLALSLIMMLPSAADVFGKALPQVSYPVASVLAIAAFMFLLAIEHWANRLVKDSPSMVEGSKVSASIPIILTVMIAIPSFFLGVALGVSDPKAAALIFIAVILHKGTAAFAIALAMTRSTLTKTQALLLFTGFAISTPLGILAGGSAATYMGDSVLLLKAIAMALGAGTFLYIGTLHEMKQSALIQHCCKLSCFLSMLAGLVVTALVRWIVLDAQQF